MTVDGESQKFNVDLKQEGIIIANPGVKAAHTSATLSTILITSEEGKLLQKGLKNLTTHSDKVTEAICFSKPFE
jgi:hypothetical protein